MGRLGASLDGAELRPFLSLGNTTLDGSRLFDWAGAGVEVAKRFSPQLDVRLRTRGRQLRFAGNDARPYADRRGWRQDSELRVGFAPDGQGRVEAALYGERAWARQDFRSYREVGIDLLYARGVTLAEPLPGPLTLYLGGGISRARYDGADDNVDERRPREEWTAQARLGASLALGRGVSLVSELATREVRGNVALYEYRDHAALVGLQLDF